MFLSPQKTIVFGLFAAVAMVTTVSFGQQTEFDRRMAAMQQARSRGVQPPPVRIAAKDTGLDFEAPPRPVSQGSATRVQVAQNNPPTTQQRTAPRPLMASRQRAQVVQQAASRSTNRVQSYLPQHLRTSQLPAGSVMDGGAPIVDSTMAPAPMMGQVVGEPIISDGYIDSGASACCGECSGTCGSCMDGGCYFDDPCCGRGGCPPGPCWVNGVGQVFFNGEYFAGATAFRSTLFSTPGGAAGSLTQDSSHGFYQGMNFGLPLCRITCGVLSAQLGFRTTQTNFNGALGTTAEREQLFLTAGFFRRVDYGLQYGIVWDYLNDEWFSDVEVVQLRGEIGYVYPNGSTFGFRYATNLQDDVTRGTFAGNPFTNLLTATDDNYRFFWRRDAPNGGFGDFFLGWSESRQAIVGLDADMPLTDSLAMQSGFNYYLNNDGLPAGSTGLGGNAGEAYNFYIGMSYRPRGRQSYRSYDRPLLPVADNGSMLITRN